MSLSSAVRKVVIDRLWMHNSFSVRLWYIRVRMPFHVYRLFIVPLHFVVELKVSQWIGDETDKVDPTPPDSINVHCACPFSSACESILDEKCHIAFDIQLFFLRTRCLPVISMNEPSFECQDSSKYVHVIPSVRWKCFVHSFELHHFHLHCVYGPPL